jgi:hypothetical protein
LIEKRTTDEGLVKKKEERRGNVRVCGWTAEIYSYSSLVRGRYQQQQVTERCDATAREGGRGLSPQVVMGQ